ncbi:MAG: rhomboid family intramembrane serine protease, partial [Candidatus Diapherotrites archaeon]|nr:rhomboid family intramembrane serine protease [Candidatus Diapherotrites archaeon]
MLSQKGFITPLCDYLRTRSYPIVTVCIILVNIYIFFFSVALNFNEIIYTFGFIPARASPLTAFTHMFLHANILHLAGNLWFFWIFGDNVEDALGKGRFILLYFLSGFGAIFLHFLFNLGSEIPCIGASGAISGVLGAYVLLDNHSKINAAFVPPYIHHNARFW